MSANPNAVAAMAVNSASLLLMACLSLSSLAEAQEHKLGSSFRDCPEVCPEVVVIPPGSYLMGAAPDDPHQNPAGEEQPQHRVKISYALAVGKYEVTRDEYAVFVRETALSDPNGCNAHEPPRWRTIMGLSWHNTGFPQSGRDPVVCVSWQEAKAYTKWLSGKTGHTYRLLSEAEWEYADRAGSTGQAYWGDDQGQACLYANGVDATLTERFPNGKWENTVSCHDGYIFTAPVGSLRPNVFGLYDMEGNAFEWVEDCWIADYKLAPDDGTARVPRSDCTKRVNRGGSWTAMPTGLRSAHRGCDNFERTRVVDLGFRVARELP
jgi:sulfatase modifying factor 1